MTTENTRRFLESLQIGRERPECTTVADLILALATYPLESEVTISDPFIDLGVLVDEGGTAPEYYTAYLVHDGAMPYERPDIIREVVERNHPGDDHATAAEFLEWLRAQGIGLVNAGHRHNEVDSPMPEAQRATLAERFAERPNT